MDITKPDFEKRLTEQSKLIFTIDNLSAITFYLNNLIPFAETRVKTTEYETIVHNAKIEGCNDLVQKIIDKINS